jgi:hypothetical protein
VNTVCIKNMFWGLETAQKNNEKIWATSDMLKVECCGSSLLTSNRKNEFGNKLMISKQNRKWKSAMKVVANGGYTEKFQNKITYEGKRESD